MGYDSPSAPLGTMEPDEPPPSYGGPDSIEDGRRRGPASSSFVANSGGGVGKNQCPPDADLLPFLAERNYFLSYGAIFAEGWNMYKTNWAFMSGSYFFMSLFAVSANYFTFGVIGTIAWYIYSCGMTLAVFNVVRDGNPLDKIDGKDLFGIFYVLPPVMMASLCKVLVLLPIALLVGVAQYLVVFGESGTIRVIGFILLVPLAVALFVFGLCLYFTADLMIEYHGRITAPQCVKYAWTNCFKQFKQFFGVMVLVFLVGMSGFFLFFVGVFMTMPLSVAVGCVAFKEIFALSSLPNQPTGCSCEHVFRRGGTAADVHSGAPPGPAGYRHNPPPGGSAPPPGVPPSALNGGCVTLNHCPPDANVPEFLATRTYFLSYGDIFAQGWKMYKTNALFLSLSYFFMFILAMALNFFTFGTLGTIFFYFYTCGLTLAIFNVIRDGNPYDKIDGMDMFNIFYIMLPVMLTSFLKLLVLVPLYALVIGAQYITLFGETEAIRIIGLCLLFPFLIILLFISLALYFSADLMIEYHGRLNSPQCVKYAWIGAVKQFGQQIGVLIMVLLVAMSGVFLFFIGIFITMPLSTAVACVAFKEIHGLSPVPNKPDSCSVACC